MINVRIKTLLLSFISWVVNTDRGGSGSYVLWVQPLRFLALNSSYFQSSEFTMFLDFYTKKDYVMRRRYIELKSASVD